MNHFNLLPPEIIEFIFKKSNSIDLINLRIVDKRFKQICDQIKIKQLCVSDKLDKYYQPFWFYTNNQIYSKENVIEFSKFQNYATIFQLDKHLKRLALNIDGFDFSILNELKLLEQLRVTTYKLNDNYKLSLDHLKIVDFCFWYGSSFKLTLDTIKLFAFKFVNRDPYNNFVLNYPAEILSFEIFDVYDFQLSADNCLKNFNNLQYLKLFSLYCLHDNDRIGRYILSQFKDLKMLDLFIDSYYVQFDKYDNLINNIRFLISGKENLKRSELEIYLNGVKLINQNKINQFRWSSNDTEFESNLLEFQIKNFGLLKDNCDNHRINYCDLIKLIKIIPSSFANKFPFIHEIKANAHIDNEDQFIKFLNNLQHLSKLVFINCELTKLFYEQLINMVYLNDLKYLTIEEKQDLEINFDFILHLKQLKNFQTNQIIANHYDLIYKLFKANDLMFFFVSKFDLKNYIEIYKEWNGLFNIESYYLDDNLKKIFNFSIFKLKNLDDVISRLKKSEF